MTQDRQILEALFEAALGEAKPAGKFDGLLPEPPGRGGRTLVLGAGKAAASMAAAFEAAWPHGCTGLVVTRYDHGAPTQSIEVVEAAHPVPDAAGEAAARRILKLAEEAGPDDLVIFLISGGASALLSLPAEGVSAEEKRRISRALLKSGAAIGEMNRVRRALSAIKGGRLAAAADKARQITYLISDVPGDDPAVIGSGPTIPAATAADADPEGAIAILARYGIEVSEEILAAMRANPAPVGEAPGPVHMLATPRSSLEAAARKASELGLTPLILGDAIEGEARDVAAVMAGMALSAARYGDPARPPCVLISGGETTVTVKGNGRGGRNAEFLLALLLRLEGSRGVSAIACDTDGIDGIEDNAGAIIDAGFIAGFADWKAAAAHLADNDAWGFFSARDQLVTTGPTLTNVNDFRAILIR